MPDHFVRHLLRGQFPRNQRCGERRGGGRVVSRLLWVASDWHASGGALGLDLGPALAAKTAYNAQREDHKPENRNKPGGKAY